MESMSKALPAPPKVYSFPFRILRQYWGNRNVPEDMSEYYLHSKERAFSLCGQIVASLILSVSNVPLYSPHGPGRRRRTSRRASRRLATRIAELGRPQSSS